MRPTRRAPSTDASADRPTTIPVAAAVRAGMSQAGAARSATAGAGEPTHLIPAVSAPTATTNATIAGSGTNSIAPATTRYAPRPTPTRSGQAADLLRRLKPTAKAATPTSPARVAVAEAAAKR